MDTKFDFKSLPDFFNMAIIAKSGGGKTVLLKHILSNTVWDFIFLFIGSEMSFSNNNYWLYFYRTNTFIAENKGKDYIPTMLTKITEWAANNKEKKIKTLLVFDDIGEKHKQISNFVNECRHGNICTLFLLHEFKHLARTTRHALNYIILVETSPHIEDVFDEACMLKDTKSALLVEIKDMLASKSSKKKVYMIFNTDEQKLYYYLIPYEELDKIDNYLTVFSTDSPLKSKLEQIYMSIEI